MRIISMGHFFYRAMAYGVCVDFMYSHSNGVVVLQANNHVEPSLIRAIEAEMGGGKTWRAVNFCP